MQRADDRLTSLARSVVEPMGYELVGVEYFQRSARSSLLRVYIDHERGITLDDCTAVSHQLSGVLDVEDPLPGNYDLEVSSPGLDRPLRRAADYERFAGQEISLMLKQPFQGRKGWKGLLSKPEHGEGWALVFNDGKTDQVLAFTLDEVREARLVPVVDFKGRRGQKAAAEPTGADRVLGGQER